MLACLLFNIGVINTTDNDRSQRVLTEAVHLQQLTTPTVRPQSRLVYNSCDLTPSRTRRCINIYM